MLANEFIRLPYQSVNETSPGTPRWGLQHKHYMRDTYKHMIAIKGPTQEMPTFDARVEVDPVVTDYWGIPVARLSGKGHIHSCEISQVMAEKAELWLKEAGAYQTWREAPQRPRFSGGQHQSGTCRMGNDPDTSVVDKTCRIHQTDNVYVVDASVHVTNGGFNPVLTIMALAYMASDAMKRNFA